MFNHIVSINKTLSEIIPKTDAKRRGFHHKVSTTKPPLRDHPNSCPNDRDYIAGIGKLKIQIEHDDVNFAKNFIAAFFASNFFGGFGHFLRSFFWSFHPWPDIKQDKKGS